MANINPYLQKILDAVYGEEVRGSIHDALAAMNVESNLAMEYAATAQDSAQKAAQTATDKATEASDSADKAKDSEDAAKQAENEAKAAQVVSTDKAAEAAASAAAAKNSETNSAASEAAALQKAAEAEASKNAAALSETNALASEDRVRELKDNMEALAAQTATDKNLAEAAKAAAERHRDDSAANALAASNAQLAAEQAQEKSEEARDDSEAARDAAKDAQAAAEKARDDAETARDDAADSAADAEASAETAKQYSGNSPKPIGGTWWVWDPEKDKYVDTGVTCELVGPTGNGIESFEQTSGDHSPGSLDVYTLKMTSGVSKEIRVFNGINGTGIGDMRGIDFDIEIPTEGWVDHQITIKDEQFIAAAKFTYLTGAYSDCEDEMLECNVKAKDITVDGEITFTSDSDPINPITIKVVRLEIGANAPDPSEP